MKQIIFNDNNLTDEDIELKVVRVKALMINSNGKILLAHNNNTYQFPGGHTEENEDKKDCLKREVMEETGIDLEINEEPFLCITTYDNNYFGSGKKVLNSIYYYRTFTDSLPNLSKTHYDELELATDFNLYYVNFNNLDTFLKNAINDGSIDINIAKEMIRVVDVYHEVYGG